VLAMPIFERRYHLQKYINEIEAQKEAADAAKKKH
jgi:hypothetical protein